MQTPQVVEQVLVDYRLLFVALISGASFCLSFIAFLVSQMKARKELKLLKVKTVLELNDRWWSSDIFKIRREVGKLVSEWKTSQTIPKYYYLPQEDTNTLDYRRKIGRLGNFYADLNLMIDEELVCEKTVYRLFGKSQLYWILPFFQALEEERYKHTTEAKPRWYAEVEQLKIKLDKYQEN
ncbi:hypothetical protein [Vibrio nigripulchritudo]|uniref:hypothetical protein n=1 Tax=Vibrio nigripulchritudo TaxID=28173 RepID=UPI0024908111|nr:hypothetical protein [Vibrio nigripulchritudo]BDU38715.1 hypothetical protein TUMSATVNIG2_31840 [Vibrio nigripulchritudo]BDU44435.1 hypothetical protein TUMSATVNIG3_32330 [Vibrio nigripulchritudo]